MCPPRANVIADTIAEAWVIFKLLIASLYVPKDAINMCKTIEIFAASVTENGRMIQLRGYRTPD
tara:strand:+ start:187 stop:378 length:192 start_codon:yes stop_codon:yes gene_type:complete